MSAILIISDNADIATHWASALEKCFVERDVQITNFNNFCAQHQLPSGLDIIIANGDSEQQIVRLFECHSFDHEKFPILLGTATNNSNLLKKYYSAGVKDIFALQDIDRLILICQRELDALETRRQFIELEKLFTEAESKCQSLIDASEEAVAYIQDGMHMHINHAYMAAFHYSDEDDLLTKPIMDLISENYQDYFKQFLKTAGQLTTQQSFEVDCIAADNSTFKAQLTLTPAVYEGEDCLQLQVENQELNLKVNQISDKDPQTGLFSRHYFLQELEQRNQHKDNQQREITLLYIMVDGFEEIKNSHGLLSSDLVLKEIAGILHSKIQQEMSLYRFGDHAFTLLIETNDLQRGKYLAENLIRSVSKHEFKMVENLLSPTLSIGLSASSAATNPADYSLSNQLLNQSYQACHDIYSNGGNGFLAYENLLRQIDNSAEEIQTFGNSVNLKELLTYALEHDRYRLVYQPIVSIQGDTTENYAVLVRLLDNDNEEVRPDHFLKQATQYGLMADIDRWVIQQSIHEIASYRRNGLRINFFIQLSESAIRDDTLLLWIVDCIRESNAKGNWLTFQLNLPDIHDHLLAAEKLIQGLKKINCHIAINQYENNFHTEQLLSRLPVDVIKLRYTVLESIQTDETERQRLIKLNRFAHENSIKIVASRVEKPDILSELWEIGINYIQGFSLQEPCALISNKAVA